MVNEDIEFLNITCEQNVNSIVATLLKPKICFAINHSFIYDYFLTGN